MKLKNLNLKNKKILRVKNKMKEIKTPKHKINL